MKFESYVLGANNDVAPYGVGAPVKRHKVIEETGMLPRNGEAPSIIVYGWGKLYPTSFTL